MCVCVCVCTGCVDTLTTVQSLGLSTVVTDSECGSAATSTAYTREDYSVLTRFESTSSSCLSTVA